MKRVLIIVGILAIAGAGAAVVLPDTPWNQSAKKPHALPANFGAYVLNVSDGRTMAISVSNELYMLRVKSIDLPSRSDAALESELNLRTLVFGRNILVENAKMAADGIYEGDVRVGPDHVAEAQVSNGLATAVANADLAALQETAKLNKLGMWAPPPPPEEHAAPAQSAPITTASQP